MTPAAPGAPADPGALSSPQPPPPRRRATQWEALRRLLDRTPLRTKLITAVLALVVTALMAISFASVLILRPFLYTQRDSDLQRQLAGALRGIAISEATSNSPLAVNLGKAYTVNGFVQAVQQPGKQLLVPPPPSDLPGMPRTPQQPALPALPAGNWTNSSAPVIVTAPAQSGGDTWRVTGVTIPVISISTEAQTSAPLVIAVDLGPVNQEIQRLILIELSVGAAILLVVALAGVAIVRANLRPLDDIELTAGQIAAGHLDHRIPERDPHTEIGSLGRSLNTMLSHLESAFHDREQSEEAAHRSEERMRRFIADASHELRTPLTTLRGFAEYYRQRGGMPASAAGMSPAELDRIMHRLESEASRMGLLVEDLLQLARLDQQRPLDMHPVDLLTLAADAVQDARMVSPDRKVDLTVAPGAAFLVEGDEQRLRQVIGNLVNNALTHTPATAAVSVSIASGTLKSGVPAVVLDVVDDGPGMTGEQAQRVFERFYRADAARSRASGGTGLGLAIVAGLVRAHGGEVSVKTAPGDGADFRVKLPLSPDALSDDDEADDPRHSPSSQPASEDIIAFGD
jgi:two-component system, OmpR family, sensor kinase